MYVNAQCSLLSKVNSKSVGHFLQRLCPFSTNLLFMVVKWGSGIALLLSASSTFWDIKLPLTPVRDLSDAQLLVEQTTSRCLETKVPHHLCDQFVICIWKVAHTCLLCLYDVSYNPPPNHTYSSLLWFPPEELLSPVLPHPPTSLHLLQGGCLMLQKADVVSAHSPAHSHTFPFQFCIFGWAAPFVIRRSTLLSQSALWVEAN